MDISLCDEGEKKMMQLVQRLVGNEVFAHVKRFVGNSISAVTSGGLSLWFHKGYNSWHRGQTAVSISSDL